MRRLIRNTTAPSVANGDQIQPQTDGEGRLLVSDGGCDVISVTFTLDTSAYASADLVADTQEIASAFGQIGGRVVLDSVVLIDEDDQGVALNLVFSSASTSFGTENAAPSIADADARNIVGHVAIATGDYVDIGGSKIATVRNIGLLMEAASDSTSLYVAIVNGAGTPTYTASGLRAKFGFRRV